MRKPDDIGNPDLTSYDLMNARDKLSLEWAAGLYHHETNPERDIVLKEAYYKRLKAVEEGVETDWLSQPLHVGVGRTITCGLKGEARNFVGLLPWDIKISRGP